MTIKRAIFLISVLLTGNICVAQEAASLQINYPQKSDLKHDLLSFLNGDMLHGEIIQITPGNKIVWKYPGVKDFILFPSQIIDSVKLPGTINPSPRNLTIIHLTNGDSIPGEIITLDQKSVTFNPICSGIINIPRVMIKEISHSLFGKEIYSGPNDSDNWSEKYQDKTKSVKIENGVMTLPSKTWALNNVNLPPTCRISFEILSPNNNTHLQFFYFTEKGDQGYYISQTGTYFDMERMTENAGSETLDSFELSNLNTKKLELTLLVDKKKKHIILMCNGKIIKDVTDDFGPFAGKGQSIAFYNMGRNPLNLAGISVTEWDGSAPVPGETSMALKTKDKINFINKDKSSGTLKSIHKGIIEFSTEFGEIKVPFDRIKNIFLASENQQLARRNKNDIQAFLHNGGRITFNLDKMTDKIISGNSENFGIGSFNIGSFEQIKFNIYQKRASAPITSVSEEIEIEEEEIEEIIEVE